MTKIKVRREGDNELLVSFKQANAVPFLGETMLAAHCGLVLVHANAKKRGIACLTILNPKP